MSYLLDDASSGRLQRATTAKIHCLSLWFKPDDSSRTCVLYGEWSIIPGNGYLQVQLAGATDDKVYGDSSSGTSAGTGVGSSGTVNYNAWNHVYFATIASNMYISLNGETLVDGGSGSYVEPTATTTRGLGVLNGANHFSGYMAEFAEWDAALHNCNDSYKSLALGMSPRRIGYNTDEIGANMSRLIQYTPLYKGYLRDYVTSGAWSVLGGATADHDHPRVFGLEME